MKKSERASWTSLFLILFVGLAAASVASITWSRTFTFTITGATGSGSGSSTPNFQGYSNSGCTTPITGGGTEDLGSFGSTAPIVKNFYIYDTNRVSGGRVHWNFTATTAPVGFIGGGMSHVHSDGTLHELENHLMGTGECLPVRLSISFISPHNSPGAKSVTVNIGRA